MRVMVTGGTGYLGAYSVKALVDAGHEVRLLARNPARIDETLKPIGVDAPEYALGDMTDAAAVGGAMDGCDAVLHCAGIVALERKHAEEVLSKNPAGARTVIDAASERGLDPIVHVSSVAALFVPGEVVRDTSPPATPRSAYGRSKAEAERYARSRQAQGAPVVITYPSGVCGPAAGSALGELATSLAMFTRSGVIPTHDSRVSYVDVRDVARAHAAVMEPGKGPRRYLCGGHTVDMRRQAEILGELTGRRFRVLPVPGRLLRAGGKVLDALMRVVPFETIFTEEAMTISTRWVGIDDARTRAELGVEWRDLHETLAEALRALHVHGLLSAAQIGGLRA